MIYHQLNIQGIWLPNWIFSDVDKKEVDGAEKATKVRDELVEELYISCLSFRTLFPPFRTSQQANNAHHQCYHYPNTDLLFLC